MSPVFKAVSATLLTLLAVALLWANRAHAGTATINWSLPTQNTDGSTIAAGTLASTTVAWGSCGSTAGTFGVEAGRAVVAVPTVTYTVTLAPATYCFRALVSTTGGISSDWSLVASKVVPTPLPPTPKPPVLVTVNTVAYEITLHPVDGPRLGRVVGSVPLGTECGAEPIVGADYYEVPRSSVTLSKPPKSSVIVAQCRPTA